ncbi:MAG: type II toxin-antitoxin system Phd/YefM family antitoxin [Burkholderiaceae bacterium]|nr:type II toxin-antitoxin system Phd/YefM family antitoxin [Burkholderiaceae bacterium]
MDTILSSHSIGISELREAPARAFEQAGQEAVVVLNHNKPAGYIVSNKLMAQILDQLADRVVTDKARHRAGSIGKARKISIDEL